MVNATASNAGTVIENSGQVECYCRYLGHDDVESDGAGNTNLVGIKTVCSSWLDKYDKIYESVYISVAVMIALNMFITYAIKLAFSSCIILFRDKTTNHILISISVFVLNSWFIGVYPTLVFESEDHEMPREWYLKAGPLFMLYYLALLVTYPLEVLIIFLAHKATSKIQQGRAILQKELDEASKGAFLNYSHKIGRLMAHLLVAFMLSPGLPLLSMIFFTYLLIYCAIEKAMVLKFYRKMENISAYIRQFTIQVL